MKNETNKPELHPALHYLSTHPHLNLSSIAREVGVDPSNFKKMVSGKVGMREEVSGELERVLGEYGYGGVKWLKASKFVEGCGDEDLGVGLGLDGNVYDNTLMVYSVEDGWEIETNLTHTHLTHIIPLTHLLNLPKE